MKHVVPKFCLVLMIAALMTACATSYEPVPSVTPVNVNAGGHALKAQNVVVILDASSSMAEGYQQWKKLDVATAVVRNMARTVPTDMGIKSGLRIFGGDPKLYAADTTLISDMGEFDKVAYEASLATVSTAGGTSPLAAAIDGVASDLDGLEGNSAVIIVTDAKNMGMGPVASATALKEKFGASLCTYPVLVGDDADGQILVDEIAAIGACGFAANADNLAGGQQIADFVKKVFVGAMLDSDGDGVADAMDKCPGTPAGVKVDIAGCPLDSDKDGVPDYMDKCPETPVGLKVNASGCPITVLGAGATSWTFNNINFETSKADIQSSSYGILDEIAAALGADPQLKVVVEGHSDSSGPREYNMDLSQRRAQAVVDYLTGKGVSPSRLTAKGFGPDRPIADNATRLGRSKNRRVQFTRVE